jgi:hypothetical protein
VLRPKPPARTRSGTEPDRRRWGAAAGGGGACPSLPTSGGPFEVGAGGQAGARAPLSAAADVREPVRGRCGRTSRCSGALVRRCRRPAARSGSVRADKPVLGRPCPSLPTSAGASRVGTGGQAGARAPVRRCRRPAACSGSVRADKPVLGRPCPSLPTSGGPFGVGANGQAVVAVACPSLPTSGGPFGVGAGGQAAAARRPPADRRRAQR